MNPWDGFNPLDPNQLIGAADPAQLLAAAAKFPGGASGLAFALFWAPAGLPIAYFFAGFLPGIPVAVLMAGIPAGVVLARHAGINPAIIFGLYVLSDVLGAAVTHPLYAALRRVGRHVPLLRGLGRLMMRFAMLGTRVPRAEDIHATGRVLPVLFRIGTVGFGIDVYTAGMLVAGLPVPRLLGWTAAIVGDLLWFAILLGVSIVTAAVVDDYRIQIVVVLVATFGLQFLAKRFLPALRDPAPTPDQASPSPALQPASEPAALTLSGAAADGASSAFQPALAFAGPPPNAPLYLSAERTTASAASYVVRPPAAPAGRPNDHARAAQKLSKPHKKRRRR